MTPADVLWLVIAVASVFAAYGIGRAKGRPSVGLVLGFILGPLGVLITACLPKTHERKVTEAREAHQIAMEAAAPPRLDRHSHT